jgi:integrase
MKSEPKPPTAVPATLQDVIDRLVVDPGLSETRKRDLRSAVVTFAKLGERTPAMIALDLAAVRAALDGMVPAEAKVSRKRWANLRSDLAAAIEASGLCPMLKTADVELDQVWSRLLGGVRDRRVRFGLSRFARWASLRRITPEAVDDAVMERFIAELEAASLVRHLRYLQRSVAKTWNILVRLQSAQRLKTVEVVPLHDTAARRLPWERLPAPFRADVERYLDWCAVPDPLDEHARAKALAPRTLHLRRNHIHSAVTAASAAGVDVASWTSVASLVDPETVTMLLRQRWAKNGHALTAYTHGIARTLIAIAAEWVKAPAETIATLKKLRGKLGTLPSGLTEKNKTLLRKFEDPRLLDGLIRLPDRLWRRARRNLATSPRAFLDLQTAIAIDFLIHVPLRMENLAALNFKDHLHWPQGRAKPALVVFGFDETKNDIQLEYEIPTVLADRLHAYRNEIAPAVIGKRPDAVFVTRAGKPRTQQAVTTTIVKAVHRHLGVKLTPHQFRHLAAKIILDANPGAYELVRQLLGHKNLKTTTNFYAGIDTRRAGRAHAELVMRLRDSDLGRRRHRPLQSQED